MKETRAHYEQLFRSYPDVVTLPEFCMMLGGIGHNTARKLLRENRLQHFYVRCTYLIPKGWVIDYVLSDHYKEYKKTLKVQI